MRYYVNKLLSNLDMKALTISAHIFIFSFSITAFSKVSVQYINNKKESYSVGDTIDISVIIEVPANTCFDGIKQTKIFLSGVAILKQSQWCELRNGFWKKDIKLTIIGNRSNQPMLTILRKNDEELITLQELFVLTKRFK
jgi:hypothetical protein